MTGAGLGSADKPLGTSCFAIDDKAASRRHGYNWTEEVQRYILDDRGVVTTLEYLQTSSSHGPSTITPCLNPLFSNRIPQ
jgi:hypothetical protein